jgi:hypothetical protein
MRFSLGIACVSCVVIFTSCNSLSQVRPSRLDGLKPDYTEVPEESLRAAAMEIERAVQRGDREPQLSDREGLVLSAERIRHAISTRAARAQLVNELLEKGHAWERRNGHLYLLNSKEYAKTVERPQKRIDALVVTEEAGSRWAIYEGLMEENNYSRKAMEAVQVIFHEARLAVMDEGYLYENEAGEMVAK